MKLWRPGWFDGVALVVGAALPDLVFVGGCCGPPQTYGHTGWGIVVGMPVTLVVARLVRWAAPAAAAHLPQLGWFALRDYGVLGVVQHPWWVSAASALLGAASHVGWDNVTHASMVGTGLGLPSLGREAFVGVPWWILLHLISTIVGAAGWLALSLYIGRNRLLVRWHGPAPVVAPRPRLFWCTAVTVAGAGVVVTTALAIAGRHDAVTFLAPPPKPMVLVMRMFCVGALAMVTGAAAVRAVAVRDGAGGARQLNRTAEIPSD